MKRVSFIAALLVMNGCGSSSRSTEESDLLRDRLRDVAGNSLCYPATMDQCVKEEVEFRPGAPVESSLGQRILLLDIGKFEYNILRYRNRILGLFRRESGKTIEHYPVIRVTRDGRTIADEVNGSSRFIPFEITSKWLDEYLMQHFALQWEYDDVTSAHGDVIFTYLADRNPQAQFVIVRDEVRDYYGDDYCQLASTDPQVVSSVLAQIAARYQQAAADLSDLVRRYQISFINFSAGEDIETLNGIFGACSQAPTGETLQNLLELFRSYLKEMTKLKNDLTDKRSEVILFQAAAASGRTLNENDPDYLSDCDSNIDNRIRVGVFSYLGEDIGPTGSNALSLLSSMSFNALACTDVYVNTGYEKDFPENRERTRCMKSSLWGLESSPFVFPAAPSFTTPVALSYVIYLEQLSQRSLTHEEMIKALNNDRQQMLIDPIQHDQLEVYREGYLTRD